mgnify:FL=1
MIRRRDRLKEISNKFVSDRQEIIASPPFIPMDRDDYLTMLAVGYICSSGSTKRVYENDFMKNLAFSLHWQPPSMYIIQNKIKELSAKLHTTAFDLFQKEPSVTLIVYPWMDINKKCTLSFILSSASSIQFFFSHTACKPEEWTPSFILMESSHMIDLLAENNIYVSLLQFDNMTMFDDLVGAIPQVLPHISIPFLYDSIQLCNDILSPFFSESSLISLKQTVFFHFVQSSTGLPSSFKYSIQTGGRVFSRAFS